jgi:hypothetical protein
MVTDVMWVSVATCILPAAQVFGSHRSRLHADQGIPVKYSSTWCVAQCSCDCSPGSPAQVAAAPAEPTLISAGLHFVKSVPDAACDQQIQAIKHSARWQAGLHAPYPWVPIVVHAIVWLLEDSSLLCFCACVSPQILPFVGDRKAGYSTVIGKLSLLRHLCRRTAGSFRADLRVRSSPVHQVSSFVCQLVGCLLGIKLGFVQCQGRRIRSCSIKLSMPCR